MQHNKRNTEIRDPLIIDKAQPAIREFKVNTGYLHLYVLALGFAPI